VIRTHEEHLAHYGIQRRSGRYPWGSGDPETTRNRDFLDSVDILKKQGVSEANIAKGMGLTVSELRAKKTIAGAQVAQAKYLTAQRHRDDGWGYSEIGRRMGLNESSVRAILARGEKDKANKLQTTANMLKDQVAEKKYVDIGVGVERHLGITRNSLDTSVAMLKEEGYSVYTIKSPQLTTGQSTTEKVLVPPGVSLHDVQVNRGQIQLPTTSSVDYGRSYPNTIQKPISVNSKRIAINYAEQGGDKADGVMYVRPGVDDLRIGNKRYAQVRVAVDGTHYLKGMAVYKDDLPDGVDIVFNTNKSNTGRKKDVMKEISDDPTNPFGSIVRQVHGPTGKVNSAMNIVNEEGSWDKWSRTLSSQVLSKQSPALARQQLHVTYERRIRELGEINSLTNPTVRKDLLIKFADETDSAAVHLKAASLPRQATKVLLPIKTVKEGEIYAPSFRDGERVALIRYPHGGTFEIPQLTVNNRNREARRVMGTQAEDAVGINHKVAHRLSGADFDGDTVLVIPNNKGSIKSTPALEGLRGFDPQIYKLPKDSPIPRINPVRKQQEMGNVSNLITDMTIKGASTDELARAIRHSMVVIDSEKHELDFARSEKDNGIRDLKEKYQGSKKAGASTLISRAGARVFVPEKTPRPASKGGSIDPKTGKKVFVPTGRTITDRKTGAQVTKLVRSKRLAETDDAHTLVSKPGTEMEDLYANHSNQLKSLANQARKESLSLKAAPYSPSAKAAYSNEVASLNAKLNVALMNAPLERQAQRIGRTRVSQQRQANPNMPAEEVKKVKQLALNDARNRTGAGKERIQITQSEWNAIQAGAISKDKLEKILYNADTDTIRRLALPKQAHTFTPTMVRTAQVMTESGYTQQEIADRLGVGLTTLKVGLSEA